MPFFVRALSGTCSSHLGVNCNAGSDWDGSVICNDGWTYSSELYSEMISCRDEISCSTNQLSDLYYRFNITGLQNDIVYFQSLLITMKSDLDSELIRIENQPIAMELINGQKTAAINKYNSDIILPTNQLNLKQKEFNTAMSSVTSACKAYGIDNYNLYINDSIKKWLAYNDGKLVGPSCAGDNSFTDFAGDCYCKAGYYKYNGLCILPSQTEKQISCPWTRSYKDEIGICRCLSGYVLNQSATECISNYQSIIENETLTTNRIAQQISNDWTSEEKKLVSTANASVINRLRGLILLQVEEHGEAWYIDPKTNKKYYLKDGQAAYEALRKFGLGITNVDLEKIPIEGSADKGSSSIIARMKGKILLQVQKNGEAWYVNPKDGKRYYLANGEEAYRIMKILGTGIKNIDLRKIPVGDL